MRHWLCKVALITSALSFSVQADTGTNYLLATASTGGTYYPVGVALATLTKVKIQPKHKVSVSAINSAGSGENIKLLRDKEAQFAILQGLYGSYAVNGSGPLEKEGKQTHLRSITMLWQNVEQFVVKNEHAKDGDLSDLMALAGKKVALGKKNSGTIGSNRFLLGNLGVDIDKQMELFSAGYGPSAEALQNGQVEAINTPAGAPTGAVTKLFAAAAKDVSPLDVTDEQMEKANGGLGLWTRYVIPAGTYPNLDKDWNTMAQPNFLAVHADVDEEFVYLLTKTIYENLGFLQAIHKATNAMALDKALAGLPAPLHPGAARYYREAGLNIPDNLVAQ
ncbi:TAXI family TRAP transporter solute-binding subunit [Agarivorans sp. B2Z047]|uniref:TAXI family TRAP transporter solute-binding subunit n=1 Tax=Agarivorans sp. B2Z047 TaxID=2652721 RepID=UPI00128CAB51|nr:TAXI family TRAP transporter solute-binding subunit [Agarivorans sp. B2Z047]MPW28889.1 TAXI family TRAP transporter solute-binding subunit [Agarivorans sp. B2Z047]UQN41447.1 TAXI family TRAP transporter solute-binding subunit [Agarivorans sp. B2Z047]